MSDDITSIIQGAVTEAEGGSVDDGDSDVDIDTSDNGGDVPVNTETSIDADAEADAAAAEASEEEEVQTSDKKPTQDDIDKELEALGIKPPVEGQRENRIPYNRVRKIVENSRKRLTEQHTTALKGVSEKLTTAEKTIGTFDRVAATDPDALMAHLVKTHPGKYDKFVKPTSAEPVVDDTMAGMPKPDYVFEDGSLGYTMEGNRKVMEWTIATARKQAVADANAEMTKRFGVIEQRETVASQRAAMQPRIDAQIAHATEVWGPLFTEDYNKANSGQSEILNYMQAHPGMPFEACAAAVLTPKLRQSETEIRAKVFKEMNGRKAAAKIVPASKSVPEESTEDQDTADIIREAIAGLR